MESKRGKLNSDHLISKRRLFAELLNAERTPEHTKGGSGRRGKEIALGIEGPIEVVKKRMASPSSSIREIRLGVEIGQSAFRGAEVAFAGIHRLIGVIGNGEHTWRMKEGMATPEAGSRRRIRRALGPGQDLLHDLTAEPMGGMGHFDGLEDIGITGERIGGNRNVLLCGQSKGKNNGSLGKLLLGRHLFRYGPDLKVHGGWNHPPHCYSPGCWTLPLAHLQKTDKGTPLTQTSIRQNGSR
jgi:hypothetical protein